MTSPALLRLTRCRHPNRIVMQHGSEFRQDCNACGSHRSSDDAGYHWSWWTRPKLVADLIAEKKGSGK